MKKLLVLFTIISTHVFAFQSETAKSDTTIIEYQDKGLNKKVVITSPAGKMIVFPKNMNVRQILKAFDVDSLEREKVWVLLDKGENYAVVINRSGDKISVSAGRIDGEKDAIVSYTPNEKEKDFDVEIYTDNTGPKSYTPYRFFKRSDFNFYLGLNTYTGQDDVGPNNFSELRIWPSRYLALSFRKNITLANTEKTQWALGIGPEFAWNNFMLTNSHVLRYENQQVGFVQNDNNTSKSKFVIPHINVPVMLSLGLKKEKVYLGVGGYVGYRVGGYTKEKFTDGKNKEKIRGNIGLNQFKYGLTAEVGRKNGSALFIRYDLSDLFKDSQKHMPDMSTISFGVRLF